MPPIIVCSSFSALATADMSVRARPFFKISRDVGGCGKLWCVSENGVRERNRLTSQLSLPNLEAVERLRRHLLVRLRRAVKVPQLLAAQLRRVEPGLLVLHLHVLEGASRVHAREETNEQRHRVRGKVRLDVGSELLRAQLLAVVHAQGNHAGTAVGTRHLHAVDGGLEDARVRGEHLGDLHGRHVLALPPECVADAVDEVREAVLAAQQIAGAEVRVALLEDVAEHLLLSGLLARVALEVGRGALGRGDVRDRRDQLAGCAVRDDDAVARLRVAHGLLVLDVELHDVHRLQRLEDGTRLADGTLAGVVLAVVEGEGVALRGSVELADLRDVVPALEVVPDLRAKTVADGNPEAVLLLCRVGLRSQEVPAQLADVLHHRRLVLRTLLPVVRRRELLAHNVRRALADHRHHAQVGGRVVQRHARAVDDVVSVDVVRGHARRVRRQLQVRDLARLRHARGAGRVDVPERVSRVLQVPAARLGVHGRGGGGADVREEVDGARDLAQGLQHSLLRLVELADGEGLHALCAQGVLLRRDVAGAVPRAVDDAARLRHLHRVHEGLALDVGVEHRNLDARLGHAQPHGNVQGVVLHVQRHAAARREALHAHKPVRNLVAQLVQLPEGVGLSGLGADQRDLVHVDVGQRLTPHVRHTPTRRLEPPQRLHHHRHQPAQRRNVVRDVVLSVGPTPSRVARRQASEDLALRGKNVHL
eukprot:Rhum_TRINITY_DN23106_c0_g1::Rhum_TRINITY_DN23106_c0_g1_i1::g.177172::m.177172